jgi:hypothetical protein
MRVFEGTLMGVKTLNFLGRNLRRIGCLWFLRKRLRLLMALLDFWILLYGLLWKVLFCRGRGSEMLLMSFFRFF